MKVFPTVFFHTLFGVTVIDGIADDVHISHNHHLTTCSDKTMSSFRETLVVGHLIVESFWSRLVGAVYVEENKETKIEHDTAPFFVECVPYLRLNVISRICWNAADRLVGYQGIARNVCDGHSTSDTLLCFERDRDAFPDIGDGARVAFCRVEVEKGIVGGEDAHGFRELFAGHLGFLETGDIGAEVL